MCQGGGPVGKGGRVPGRGKPSVESGVTVGNVAWYDVASVDDEGQSGVVVEEVEQAQVVESDVVVAAHGQRGRRLFLAVVRRRHGRSSSLFGAVFVARHESGHCKPIAY